jgi:hypothetical protein
MTKKREYPARPRDMNQHAKRIVDIAAGEAEDEAPPAVDPKARKRGEARAAKLTPLQRSQIAKKAARTRWDKQG